MKTIAKLRFATAINVILWLALLANAARPADFAIDGVGLGLALAALIDAMRSKG